MSTPLGFSYLEGFELGSERVGDRESLPIPMAVPGPYSGASTLALVARASAVTFGLVYGSMKLSYLKATSKSHKPASKGHH